MNDTVTAYIRTYAPLVSGTIIGLAAQAGLDISAGEEHLVGLLIVIAGAAYYALARLIGRRYPKIEAIMLGSGKKPVYVAER
ncbi:hypothetical protein [Dietzia natronolimnaea]|uniref:hypothetical protein n=1 Tax=Dietzia natronolimnaea TaxID=161920 RepID=UPI0015FE7191|nr:hypothetical protein [Dietzia natronolimnaea]MBB1037413.1 hypothetical protein [Dietzia natronolimnaea]